MHTLQKIQRLPISRTEAWDFFSSPKNLRDITPSYMGFYINSDLPEKMYPGMIISYTVKPLMGIPLNWVTEITHIRDYEFFVDKQLSGPYKIWHHQHLFRDVSGGTEMKDIVNYALPLGFAGRIAHRMYIKSKLDEIFDYRHKVLEKKFGKLK